MVEQDQEMDIEDEYNTPVENEPKFPPESMSQIFNKFVESPNSSSNTIRLARNKKGEIYPERFPSVYMERITTDAPTANLNIFDIFYIDEAYNIAQALQLVGQEMGVNLSRSSNYFSEMAIQQANISKGKDFALLRNLKTDTSNVMSKSERTINSPTPAKRRWFK